MLAAEILGGRRVSVRIEEATLMFFDPGTRELLRTPAQSADLGPGPPPARRPSRRATPAAIGRSRDRSAGGHQHRRHHDRRERVTEPVRAWGRSIGDRQVALDSRVSRPVGQRPFPKDAGTAIGRVSMWLRLFARQVQGQGGRQGHYLWFAREVAGKSSVAHVKQ